MDAAVGIAIDDRRSARPSPSGWMNFDLGVGQRHEHGYDAVLRQRHRGNIGAECTGIDFKGLLGVSTAIAT